MEVHVSVHAQMQTHTKMNKQNPQTQTKLLFGLFSQPLRLPFGVWVPMVYLFPALLKLSTLMAQSAGPLYPEAACCMPL